MLRNTDLTDLDLRASGSQAACGDCASGGWRGRQSCRCDAAWPEPVHRCQAAPADRPSVARPEHMNDQLDELNAGGRSLHQLRSSSSAQRQRNTEPAAPQSAAAAPPPRKKTKVGQLSSDGVNRAPRPHPQRPAARPAAELWAGGASVIAGTGTDTESGSPRRIRCDWDGCAYVSTGSGHMKRHMRTHTGERPYVCSWQGCTYSAAQSVHLVQHMRSHTGERPFKCTVADCKYAASRSGHLKRHMRVHSQPVRRAHKEARQGSAGKVWQGGARAATVQGSSSMYQFDYLSGTNPEEDAAADLAAAAATLFGATAPELPPGKEARLVGSQLALPAAAAAAAAALDQVVNAAP